MIEIKRCENGALDELKAENALVHLEKLNRTTWFLLVKTGEETLTVEIDSIARINPRVRWVK